MRNPSSTHVMIENGQEQVVLLGKNGLAADQFSKADASLESSVPKRQVPGANNVRLVTPEERRAHAEGMTSEELAEYVVQSGWGDVLAKLVQLKPYIQTLWARFDELKGTATIAGCRTKEQYCAKCLNRSIRAVQYMLYGRTPKKPNSSPSAKQHRASKRKAEPDQGGSQAALSGWTPEPDNDAEQHSGLDCSTSPTRTGSEGNEKHDCSSSENGGGKQKADGATEHQIQPPATNVATDWNPVRLRISESADTSEIEGILRSSFQIVAEALLHSHPHNVTRHIIPTCIKPCFSN